MDSISKYEENQEYYENLDKRTKEYKDYASWKQNYEASSEGLGDSIEKITEATGIKKAVEFLSGGDCGCEERKKLLNELIPYKKPKCLTESEYNWLKEYFSEDRTTIAYYDQKLLVDIYNRVFNERRSASSCSSCVANIYNTLKKYFEAYTI